MANLACLRKCIALSIVVCATSANACWIEYEWRSAGSPFVLAGSISGPSGVPDLLSLSVTDVSEAYFSQALNIMAALDASDEQAQQITRMLAEVLLQQYEMELSIVRYVAGSSRPADDPEWLLQGAGSDYELVLNSSLPGFREARIPLACLENCEGEHRSSWRYVREVPEPPLLPLVLTAMGVLGLYRAVDGRGQR